MHTLIGVSHADWCGEGAPLDCALGLVPAPIAVVDATGCVRRWNRDCEELFGVAAREVVDTPIWDLAPDQDAASAYRAAHQQLRAGDDTVSLEVPAHRAGQRWVQWRFRALRGSDGFRGAIGTAHDVTRAQQLAHQVRAQRDVLARSERTGEALAREHRARLGAEDERDRTRAVLQSAPIGMILVEAAGRVIANNALLELVGAPIYTGRGARYYLRDLLEGDGAPREWPWEAALSGRAVRQRPYRLARGDGRQVAVEINALPMRGISGEIIAAIISVVDVSAREDLLQLQRDYVNLVGHDLRGPLSVLVSGLEVLDHRLHGLDELTQATVARLWRTVGAMERMLDELLAISQLEAGRLELEAERTDVAELARQVVETSVANGDRDRVRISATRGGALAEIDRAYLAHVVANLVSNALKYSPPGSPVEVDVAREGAWAVLTVSDRGPGLTAEQQQRVFDKYERAGRRDRRGIGLGLYAARLLVEAHGGEIRVDSAPGRGARFQIALPATPAETGEQIFGDTDRAQVVVVTGEEDNMYSPEEPDRRDSRRPVAHHPGGRRPLQVRS